jgi:S-layer protein
LTLLSGTSSLAAVVDGGEGTADTLVIAAADANTASQSSSFMSEFIGFEKLSVGASAASNTVDLSNMNGLSYVISAGTSGAGTLAVTKMADSGTLELTAAGGATVTMTDATGAADTLNVVTKVNASDISFGTVAAAAVETVNITATDTTPVSLTTGAATISKATLTVSDAAAKTVVISGNSDLDLTASGAVLTTVNASAFTGKLSFSSAVDSAVVTGGSANDTLTVSGAGQTVTGGAGNDTLIVTGNLAVLTGGAGNDTFDVSDPTTNANNYATITDASAGDKIKFDATSALFKSTKIALADTAGFQDFANAAISGTNNNEISWFQYSGNTYIVENVASSSATSFTNASDVIVKLTGLVDLSTATFSTSANTLQLN